MSVLNNPTPLTLHASPLPAEPAPEAKARTMTAMIEVHHLVKQFGRFTAVDRISFSVPTGTIRAFLGPNGAANHAGNCANSARRAHDGPPIQNIVLQLQVVSPSLHPP
jgi:hypothetical protein